MDHEINNMKNFKIKFDHLHKGPKLKHAQKSKN